MRCRRFILALVVFSGIGTLHAGEARSASPSSVQDAIKAFSSEDFSTRQKALRELEKVVAQQTVAMASERDEETRASISAAWDFNVGLIRWFQDLQTAPEGVQSEEFAFVLRPEVLPALSKIFSAKTMQRMEGVRELGKLNVPGADGLLAREIDDSDRAISITAMDAAWDLKPSATIVDALWRRAAPSSVTKGAIEDVPLQPDVLFQGHLVGGVYQPQLPRRPNDGDLATEVLMHYQSPLVKEKLIAFLQEAAASVNLAGAETRDMYNPYVSSVRNAYLLVQAYKPAEAIPSLVTLATCKVLKKFQPQGKTGIECVTNRTGPLALVVQLTGQVEEDYSLEQVDLGAMKVWGCKKNDEEAVNKLRTWWESNAQKYGQQGTPSAELPLTTR